MQIATGLSEPQKHRAFVPLCIKCNDAGGAGLTGRLVVSPIASQVMISLATSRNPARKCELLLSPTRRYCVTSMPCLVKTAGQKVCERSVETRISRPSTCRHRATLQVWT